MIVIIRVAFDTRAGNGGHADIVEPATHDLAIRGGVEVILPNRRGRSSSTRDDKLKAVEPLGTRTRQTAKRIAAWRNERMPEDVS